MSIMKRLISLSLAVALLAGSAGLAPYQALAAETARTAAGEGMRLLTAAMPAGLRDPAVFQGLPENERARHLDAAAEAIRPGLDVEAEKIISAAQARTLTPEEGAELARLSSVAYLLSPEVGARTLSEARRLKVTAKAADIAAKLGSATEETAVDAGEAAQP